MTAGFRLTAPAIQDIEEIADSISQYSGLERDEILPNLRSFPIESYLILYIVIENRGVEILRVVSGYRNLPALFFED